MDTNTLMLVMAMSGGRGSNMLLPLLLMGGLGNSNGGTSSLSKVITPDAMMVGLLPGIGMAGKALIGGAGAVLAGSMLKRRSNRRKTRVVYSRRRR